MRPSSTSAAAPTGKWEYGTYAHVAASTAAACIASQSTGSFVASPRAPTPGSSEADGAPAPPADRSGATYARSPLRYGTPSNVGGLRRCEDTTSTTSVTTGAVADTSWLGTSSTVKYQMATPTAAAMHPIAKRCRTFQIAHAPIRAVAIT